MKKTFKKYTVPHKENHYRPYMLRAWGIVATFVLMVAFFFGSQVYTLFVRTSDFIASVLPSVLVDLANNDREAFALNTLTVNPLLEEAARMKANDMATKSYFSHQSPDGKSPWYWMSKSGYRFVYAGENLAIHFDDSLAVNAAWMASPGHRANILHNKFTEIGIATAQGIFEGRPTTYVVQMFGRPIPESADGVPSLVSMSTSESNPSGSVAGSEISVIPIVESESEFGGIAQSFTAVQNAEEIEALLPETSPVPAPRYASAFERYLSSPQKLLSLAYSIIGALLFIIFLAVLSVRHDARNAHLLKALLLLTALATLYYAYRALAPSGVEIALLSLR